MAQKRFIPKTFASDALETPFETAEEAWFWFVRCQEVRRQGAKLEPLSRVMQRPCDPDDIYRTVAHLSRQGALCVEHLRVLSRYGPINRPPDRRCGNEQRASLLWEQALDRLATALRQKGIVA